MKYLTLVALVVLVTLVQLSSAGRRRQGRPKCECTATQCVFPTEGQTCGVGGKKTVTCSPSDKAKCQQKAGEKNCRVKCPGKTCKYGRPSWSTCDLATQTKTGIRTLKAEGSDPSCPQTKNMTKTCNLKCKYARQSRTQWSECDSVTKTKFRTFPLVQPANEGCAPVKNITKSCRLRTRSLPQNDESECKYEKRVPFGPCENNTKKRTRNKISGGDQCQAQLLEEKPCRVKTGGRNAAKKPKPKKCRYEQQTPFGPCEAGVQTRERRKIGGGDNCPETKLQTKPCRQNKVKCRFVGEWSAWGECLNGVKLRTRELVPELANNQKCQKKASKSAPCDN